MKLSRPSRFLAALITIFSLLFTQMALGAYVCPQRAMAPVAIAADAAKGATVRCADMDPGQPGLCQAHCHASAQSHDAPAAPHVPPFVPATLSCVLPDAQPGAGALPDTDAVFPLQYASSPPIAIRNCCFRI